MAMFLQQEVYGDTSTWKTVPESMYIEILQAIETQTKANYEKIGSWQGEISIVEEDHHYGSNAAVRMFIDKDSPAANSQHICRKITANTEFAIDIVGDKLYCSFEPFVQCKAIDLNLNAPTIESVQYSRIISIVTPEEYIDYRPDHDYGPIGGLLNSSESIGKVAFRLPAGKAERKRGDIRDPRLFFNYGDSKKIWETLSSTRKNIQEYGILIIAGYPSTKIEETHVVNSKRYKITNVYHTSQNNESDYRKITIVVDSEVDFNVVEVALTDPYGIARVSIKATYEKIGDVFVHKTFNKITRDNEGRTKFNSQITFINSIINELIPEETFTYKNLGMENSSRFIDNINKVEYFYQNKELIKANSDFD
jgi:hypothetical protein